jgi:hypothetical protein
VSRGGICASDRKRFKSVPLSRCRFRPLGG